MKNKTWKELMSKQEFIDWCFTNENTNIAHIVNITTQYEYPLIVYGDNGGIINLLEYIQGTLKNREGYKLVIRLLGIIYDLYADSIPYNQELTQINLVSINKVEDDSDLIIITDIGIVIRIPLEQVSKMSRVTQGIRVITLKDDQKVSSTSISQKEDEKDENSEETTSESNN